MSTRVYFLRSKRAIRANRNSHMLAGLGMLFLGAEGLGGEHGMIRPILEIVAGGLLFAVVVFEIAQDKRGRHHDSTYEIADFFAALVALVEGIVRIHTNNFWSSRLTFVWWLVAIIFVARGLSVSRLRLFNTLTITDREFVYRRPFRKRVRLDWAKVADFQLEDSILVIEQKGDEAVRIDLRKYERAERIADWCRTEIPLAWKQFTSSQN